MTNDVLSIGPIELATPLVLAPMAGVTNAPFRTLCRRYGAGLYVSEMVSARAIVEEHERTLELLTFAPGESPRSQQLYATDPWATAEAIRWLVGEGRVDHVDLNFGCPAKKITRHGGGAALPYRRKLYAAIVRAAVQAAGAVPVTVKTRLGVDDDHPTYIETGQIAADLGVVAVALHARTAEQHYAGHADWSSIARLKNAVSSIPVLGNGDIWEASDALAMMDQTGCDGVVIGRGCLGRPWLFRDLAVVFAGQPVPRPPTFGEIADMVVEHAELLVEWVGEYRGIRQFRKHTDWYTKGFPLGGARRRSLNQVDSLAQLEDLVASIDRTIPFPDSARRTPRGHTSGPRPVALPRGFFESADDDTPLPREAATAVSGG